MSHEGSNTETLAPVESNLFEHRHVVTSQYQPSAYAPATTGPEAISWTVHNSTTNGIYSNPTYQYDQHPEPSGRSIQDGQNVTSVAGNSSHLGTANVPHDYSAYISNPSSGNSSNLGTANVPQDYNAYTSYPTSTNPYGYGSTGYYNSYLQQPNHTYSQPVGAYQNTGASYQPISSFQNTGSYTGSASYSNTYYNPGDSQTTGGYQNSSGYGDQATTWNNGSYSSYSSKPNTNYTPDSGGSYSSGVAATSVQYQQHYNQWADYYNQTEVSCAPGTEKLSVTRSSSLGCPIPAATSDYATPAATGGYATPTSQPSQSYPQFWRQESSSSAMPSFQQAAVNSGGDHDGYWNHGAQTSQNHQTNPTQPNYQSPLDLKSSYDKFQDHQKTASSQGTDFHFLPPPPPPLPPPPQQVNPAPLHKAPYLNTRQVQIPINPQIPSNLAFGQLKTEKDSSTTSAAQKPAYIAVSLPKSTEKVSCGDDVNSILKPGMFPKSLCGYVERALARCKDDKQMAACQAIMKEMITKATADGTRSMRNWDMEPLFQMPDAVLVNKDSSPSSTPDSLLPKYKRSPRRSKSRWEPLPEEKPVDNPALINNDSVRYSGWVPSEKDRKMVMEIKGSKEDVYRSSKFSPLIQRTSSKAPQRAFKKQRLTDASIASENGDASSDSDKEQSLTAYYSASMTFSDSPEERKRRENRSKRFEYRQGHRSENNHFRKKSAGAGNMYNRRASALVLSKSSEDGVSKAVEDIDWDSLTVKGTCQEIEKRYLRLTSSPDPATVRPEEVLEKALLMVNSSQKNYLYKCDQLKSIRQDLTVQRILNQLTVKVYETHARLALEFGDLPEFNQCQSQLKTLYAEGIEGSYMEFAAYNLLCVILHSNNNRDLVSSMSRLSGESKKDEAVQHALAVCAAVTSGNYVAFFRLYMAAPNLNTCLMELSVEKMRYKAVSCMCRSYRPSVPVSHVSQVLGFSTVVPTNGVRDDEDTDALEECLEWLEAHGASIIMDNNGDTVLDTKASSSTLFVPEPEDAVAHGDANLDVNDFFSRTPL
ncbi:PREDICTED: SAC3 family protein A-like isoform X1 [Lupinus angustifolius]|uniref:SAC3 family protein A-like isoform X1 n=1 Tax=Lupinus angustifolius TaxID=3871 RepID=UPI00092E2FB2|nr:PREDICTED: SAC3 family protein A-like isoform X1 [Lupinus angustifolius]